MLTSAPFAGELSFISLADVFQILGGNNSSGVLHLVSPYADGPGVIYFVDGNPINATFGSLYGLDAMYALFGWTEGSFSFYREHVHAGRIVEHSRLQIVLDALRMLDEGLIETVGPSGGEDTASEGMKARSLVLKRPIVDYLYVIDEEVIPDGEPIVREGAHGKWMWVILEGAVKITRDTSVGPITIAQLGQGSFIGTVNAFLFKDLSRSATVSAQGNVRIGLLDSQRLNEEFSMLSPDLRSLLLSAGGRLRKVTDQAVALYMKKVDNDEMLNSQMIIKKGTRLEEAFSIIGGEAYVVGESAGGEVLLSTLGGRDVFGYVPFLDMGHEPRYASVVGSGDVEMRRLNIPRLQEEYSEVSGPLRHLIEHSCNSVALTTRLVYRLHEGKEIVDNTP